MKNRYVLLSILSVAMALGTAWAVRGRFGHEQGAAWAGAIGALCLVLMAGRRDWYDKVFRITMAAAFGWGISGVISYGEIVGYGRGTDFLNVYYGLLMLFVLGMLYGFLGGGLFGLALVDSKINRVKWHVVLVEMIAIGLLTYAVLINQLEWFMTPPRSEMWAACLGASIALAWHIRRNRYDNVMRVAVWSALGAGFGFSFGNFLQVLGAVSGADFNFWNVMEYSIGFFGGAGMAYGTLSSSWAAGDEKVTGHANLVPILFVTLLIPFVVWDQSFVTRRFDFIAEGGYSPSLIFIFQMLAIFCILFVSGWTLFQNYRSNHGMKAEWARGKIKKLFLLFAALYILLSFLITGVLVHPAEQYLYVINLVAIMFLISRSEGTFAVSHDRPVVWARVALISIAVLGVLAFIAINSHEGMHGSQIRFGSKQ